MSLGLPKQLPEPVDIFEMSTQEKRELAHYIYTRPDDEFDNIGG